MIMVNVFKTEDGQYFENFEDARFHEKIINFVNKQIKMLGGKNKEICPNDFSFYNGEGFLFILTETVEAVEKELIEMKKFLSKSKIDTNKKLKYESILGKINNILISFNKDKQEIDGKLFYRRFGQPYYVNNLNEAKLFTIK